MHVKSAHYKTAYSRKIRECCDYIEQHVKELLKLADVEVLSQMTLEEKAQMCSGRDFWKTQDIGRLGIPSVMMYDGPNGLRKQLGKGEHLGINAGKACRTRGCGLFFWTAGVLRIMSRRSMDGLWRAERF